MKVPERARQLALLPAGLLAGFYLLSAIVGAVAQWHRTTPPWQLGDVGEFLLVLAAAIAFVAAIYKPEISGGHDARNGENAPPIP
jgi:carbohydrate-selective porin OprB